MGFLLCEHFGAAGNRTCDHVTGEYVCRAGYIGLTCEHPCPVGTYGLNCLEKCTCKNGADCHHVTGQFGASGCSCTVRVMAVFADQSLQCALMDFCNFLFPQGPTILRKVWVVLLHMEAVR